MASICYGYAVGDYIDIDGGNWNTASTSRRFRLKKLYTDSNGDEYAIWERDNNPTIDVKYGFTVKWDGTNNYIGVEWTTDGEVQGNDDPRGISLGQSNPGRASDIIIPSNNTTDIWMYASTNTAATSQDIVLSWDVKLIFSASNCSSGPTVTGINWISTGQQYSDGVTTIIPDGEFVTNDTITASDCTLYNDFQSYANSNITIVNDKFQITKSGTGMYSISVGGYSDTLSYVDESWLALISSNSSSRSTNSTRIRDILAKIPDDIKFHRLIGVYSPIDTGVAQARGPYTLYWKQFEDLGWTKQKSDTAIRYKFKYLNTNPNNTSAWYTDPYTEEHMFEVKEISGEIKCRFTRYKWFNDLSLNVGSTDNVLHSPWMEVGANSWKQWVWSYDSGETRHGVSNYDSWLVDERFWVKVSDWVYYEEPEGDDEGPDGNPPNNYPPSDNPPNDPTDDPDGPKHQYPGDWPVRRRRAHSFW